MFYVCPNTLPPPPKNELVGAKGFDGGLAPKRPPPISVGVDFIEQPFDSFDRLAAAAGLAGAVAFSAGKSGPDSNPLLRRGTARR